VKTKERTPTVYIVDDDEAVRGSLRLLFKSLGHPAIAYASATEFLENYDPEQPGCAVLDVRMPGMSGLELQEELNRRGAIIPVIFITGHGDVPMAVEAMQHGAFDFLQKPFREQDIITRLQHALEKDADNRLQFVEKEQIRSRLDALTPREKQVFELVTKGRPNKIMASDLGVSQRTVEIHRAHLMEKMSASSVAQLVRMSMIAGA
jgi:two-component system, LuxR family, response regulator FixJ